MSKTISTSVVISLCCPYNELVITRIKNLNKKVKGESVMTFCIFNLNTKIRDSKLLKVLFERTDFSFDEVLLKSISVNTSGSEWISNSDPYSSVFDKCLFKKTITYVLDNLFSVCIISVSSVSSHTNEFRPCSLYCSLFFLYYEEKWIQKTKQNNLIQARKFSKVLPFRKTWVPLIRVMGFKRCIMKFTLVS